MERVHLKIRRRDTPEGLSYWEEFSIPSEPGMTVLGALEAIGVLPETSEGLPTTPIAHEHNCLEELCGSCAMVVNGKVRMACSAFVEGLTQPIVLEPLSKFPVVRDLAVDRSRMFETLGKCQVWTELDSLLGHSEAPSMSRHVRDRLALFASCIMCGNCFEACPQVNDRSPFMGAFIAAQALLVNQRYFQRDAATERVDTLKGPGGMGECDNAGNCQIVCPKNIPLAEAIPKMQWEITKHSLLSFFCF